MSRIVVAVSLLTLIVLAVPPSLCADAFDNYINTVLTRVPGAKGVLKLKEATPGVLAEHSGVLPGTTAAFLVVRTNEGRFSKLLVQPARQKVSKDETVPIMLIERFVTYREGEERTILAQGQNVRLFDGFEFNLDVGQVVPAKVGGDIRLVAGPEKTALEPVRKAEMYLITKQLPEAAPKKSAKVVIGAAFQPRYFDGVYKLYDDGRRSGKLHLKVQQDGEVLGSYYSDKDGQKYEVTGKVGNPAYRIQFRITFPRTMQFFDGLMFTGDGRAITGTSRLQDRDTGFYALRVEE
jgi:hypothetical protein